MSVLRQINQIRDIPTLPEVFRQVLEAVQADESDAHSLAEVIEHDPSLSVKVLRAANSVSFTPANQRITSIQLAVARVGFDTVKNLALAMGLVKSFPQTGGALNYVTFWRHSIAVAYLSQHIAELATTLPQERRKDHYFACGLLHDIGILIYDQFFHDDFSSVMAFALEEGLSYLEAEREKLANETHGFVGGALLEMWKMNGDMVSAVRYHHAPEKGPDIHSQTTAVLYLAEHIFCNSKLARFEGVKEDDLSWANGILGLSKNAHESLLRRAETEVSKHSLIVAQEAQRKTPPLRQI